MDPRQRELVAMDLDELLEAITSPEPGSVNHEFTKMLIQNRIAEKAREANRDALHWARLSALGTALAALVSLAAFSSPSCRQRLLPYRMVNRFGPYGDAVLVV
jgi:hypothetical protein